MQITKNKIYDCILKILILTAFFRLILTSILLTSKFYNDVYYGNNFAAFVGGVHLKELNVLEAEFLNYIDWALWVEPEEFDFYLRGVLAHFEPAPPLPTQPTQ